MRSGSPDHANHLLSGLTTTLQSVHNGHLDLTNQHTAKLAVSCNCGVFSELNLAVFVGFRDQAIVDLCSGVSLGGCILEFFDLAFVWLRSDGEITQTRRRANK